MTVNVAIFAPEYDTGGQGYRIKQAFDRYEPDFSVRSINTMSAYFRYPEDVHASNKTLCQRLIAEADVIHVRNTFAGLGHYKPRPDAAYVIHYHGTLFRENYWRYASEARAKGAMQLASTIDLTLLDNGVEWLPSPYDIRELEKIKTETAPHGSGAIRIAHAPTNRRVKGTDTVMEAVKTLIQRGLNVELDLIERRTWKECLERKARADIYVDQLGLGIGNNALEAFGMRTPVVAGIGNQGARYAMIERWGGLPYFEARAENLADRLEELATDSSLRAHWGELGHQYLSRFHDERLVAAQLAQTYRNAMERAA